MTVVAMEPGLSDVVVAAVRPLGRIVTVLAGMKPWPVTVMVSSALP
jgi:hypothetical protein